VYVGVVIKESKFPGPRLVLSCDLRSKGVKSRRVGAANDRLKWVARNQGATFLDPNSWIRDVDFGRDGLRLNRNGERQLGDLYSRVYGIDGGSQKVINNWWHTAGSEFNEETSEGPRNKANQENSTLGLKAVEAEENAEKEMLGNAGKKKKGGVRDEMQITVPAYKDEGKPQVLLQVNCRSIYNKDLEFWNLVDTYKPDIIIRTDWWLRDGIGNKEILKVDFMTFRRDRHVRCEGCVYLR